MLKNLRKGSGLFFFILVAYIFASFIWWILLLGQFNQQAYEEKKSLMALQNPPSSATAMKQLEDDFNSKKWMILGEGSVFILMLSFMSWKLYQTLSRERQVQQQQKNFLLSITHELRSPIAALMIALQTIQKRRDLPAEKSEALVNNSLQDISRLHMLVENLLLATKIDDPNFQMGYEECNLSEITAEVISKLKASSQSTREFLMDIKPDIFVWGDRSGLTSVVTNLIENALKYSSAQSPITIQLNDQTKEVVLMVADEGVGIPDAEKKKIFQKFYRIGMEETRKTKGTGLGLYIVKGILNFHRGSIQVRDNRPRGSVFEVVLPKLS